jgi:hypothetical protein
LQMSWGYPGIITGRTNASNSQFGYAILGSICLCATYLLNIVGVVIGCRGPVSALVSGKEFNGRRSVMELPFNLIAIVVPDYYFVLDQRTGPG